MVKANDLFEKLNKIIGTFKPSLKKIAIIGGNPRFKQIGENRYEVSRQLVAFEMALIAYEKLKSQGYEVILCILIDHIVGQKAFLKDGAKDPKRPTLDNLKPALQDVYRPVLDKYNIPAKEILLIFEMKAGYRFDAWLKKPNNLKIKTKLEKMEFQSFRDAACQSENNISSSNIPKNKQECFVYIEPVKFTSNLQKFNCRCIFAYTFKIANKYAGLENKEGRIIGFWGEDNDRCDKAVIKGGIDIVNKYFNDVDSLIDCIYDIPLGTNDDVYVDL